MKKSLLIKLSTLTLSVCSLLCIGTACKEDEPKTTYHTVTWKNYDGNVLETDENVKSGTMPTYDSEAPTRANDAQYTYEFSGWSPEITTVAGDVVYVAQFTSVVNEYTVVWKNYDGSILETDENVQYGETPVYNGETPVKEKDVQYTYEFSGWNPETDTVTGNVTYTAQFGSTVNKYTVIWKNYDGNVLETDTNVAYGTTPAYNGETPTKARDAQYTYTFDGWDKTVDAVNGDAVYTAKFMSTVNKYTVIWKDYDGSVLETDENIDYGTLPAYNGVTPTRNRAEYTYTFSGWDKEVVTITGDVTYTAQYTQELSKYTAIWKNYDGIVLETDTGLAYQTIPEYNATTPTRTKDAQYTYTFSGWSPAISKITDDVVYTAQYSTTLNKYTVTWKNYDGINLETDSEVPYGDTPVYNANTPTREKDAQYTYTFNGWTTNVSKVTGNVDYIAKYSTTVNKYTITWKNYDGSILKTDSVAYGTKPVYNGATPTKQGDSQYGYLFSGWSPIVSNVTGDAAYIAQFSSSINKYTVIWKNYDGTVLETDNNVVYGTVPTYNGSMPNKPYDSLNEYEFEGWSPKVEGITGDTVYTAIFSISESTTFTIKYDANGGTGAPSSQTKNKGQSITLSSTIPTNGEHVFIGWSCAYDGNSYSKGSSFSVDANVVLYAIWGHGCETCGASGQVSYQKTCSTCNGNGTVKESKWYSCSGCGGDGELSAVSKACSSCSGFGGIYMFSCGGGHSWTTSTYATRKCPYCGKSGSGSKLNTCSSCSGKGSTSYYPTCSACSGSGGSYKNVSVDCSYCSNGYNTAYKTCGTCNGSKNIKNTAQTHTLTLKNGSSTFATKTVYYGDSFKLNIPTKVGYTFVGWFDAQENGKQYTDRNGVSLKVWEENNKTLYAQWIENYTITYNLDGGRANNLTVYNIETPTFTLNNPTRTGYKFIGWSGTDIDGISMEVIVPSISSGDREYTANWEIITYTITYNLNGGVNNDGNVGIYTIADDTITLLNPTKEHYNFVEWRLNGSKITEIVKGSYGDINLTAIWTPKSYSISYDLDSGTCSNSAIYNIETLTFELNDPIKVGYKFIGWSGTGIDGIITTVVIPSGSTGNREYKAHWEIIAYTITYELDGGVNNEGNVSAYTIADDTITLLNPTKEHYDFLEWRLNGNKITEIVKGSYGDISLTAIWTPKEYSILYDLDGGSASNPTVYNIETPTFTLNNPTRTGYKFIGWSGTDIDGIIPTVVIPSGSTGNREYKAHWEIIAYTITYELDGGKNNMDNVANYTVVSDAISLKLPIKAGYKFLGWTGTNIDSMSTEVVISSGSTGNREYTAHWEIVTYTITYELNGGENNANNPIEYTVESDTIPLAVPTKEYHDFVEWQLNGEKVAEISQGSYGDKILTAIWKKTTYTLSINNKSAGVITNAGSYNYNAEPVNSTATSYLGYEFLGWYEGDKLLSLETTYLFVPEKDVVAKFKLKDEMLNFYFSATSSTCSISGVKDKTITNMVIPNYVTSISSGAFKGCSQLTEISLPFVKSHFGYIFGGSIYSSPDSNYYVPSSLKKVTVSGGAIVSTAFVNCDNLISVILGDSVTNIEERAFYSCDNLTNVIIGNSVATIGDNAFARCTNLESIALGNNVAAIGEKAFNFCEKLTSIVIPDSVETIGRDSFAYCEGLINVELSNKMTSIDACLFQWCDNLTTITIPDTVTSIKFNAFQGCASLANIKIPDSVTTIENFAFDRCTALSTIYIGKGVKTIGQDAFYYCRSLTGVYIEDVDSWAAICFNNEYSNPLKYARNNLYINNELLTELTISEGVTSIGAYAFRYCSSLTSVVFPNSVKTIGDYAFQLCSSLTSLVIGDGVTSIGVRAFNGCNSMLSVVLGGSVTSIGDDAFWSCQIVEVVNKSPYITVAKGGEDNGYVGYNALVVYNSSSGVTESQLTNDNGFIIYTEGMEKILVGYIGIEKDLVIPSYITKINRLTFYSSGNLTSVIIPNSVISIGSQAFDGVPEIYCEVECLPSGWDSNWCMSASSLKYWYSENQPTATGNYWRYDENGNIVVW